LNRLLHSRQALARVSAIWVLFLSSAVCRAEDLGVRILKESRFENWQTVLRLSRQFAMRKPSDLPTVAAILDSCVSLGCQISDRDFRRGELVGPQLRKFIDAWIEYIGQNPRAGSDRFLSLADDPDFGWMGVYGGLSSAIETQNAVLLRSALERSEPYTSRLEPLREKAAEARLALAALAHDYERVATLLGSEGKWMSQGFRLSGHLTYLIWKDDLEKAKNTLGQYIHTIGLDHHAAKAEIELRSLLEPPQQLLSLIDSHLKKHPNYWLLRIARAQMVAEIGGSGAVGASLASMKSIPRGLAYPRLLRIEFLTREIESHNELIQNFSELSSKYEDYPLFHVAAANAFIRAGKHDAAIEQLDIADRQTPLYVPATVVRAILATKLGRFREAVELNKRIVTAAPNDVFAKLSLAQALVLAEDFGSAKLLLSELRLSRRYVPKEAIESLERDIAEAVSAERPR